MYQVDVLRALQGMHAPFAASRLVDLGFSGVAVLAPLLLGTYWAHALVSLLSRPMAAWVG
jgi:hypothetical protein